MVSDVKLYGYETLNTWVVVLLFVINGITFVVTFFNVLYLYKTLPKIENRIWNFDTVKTMEVNKPLESSSTALDIANMQKYIYRKAIEKYFYLMAIIPLFISTVSHYGARFPGESIWIFPGMNICIAITYLFFIRMMIISCDGWKNVENILIDEEDECHSCKNRLIYNKCCKRFCCKLCLKQNAFQGLKQRILFCFLIILKPIINYGAAYFEYDYGSEYNQKYIGYLIRMITICVTVIPQQNMNSFHCTLLPYTRLRKSSIKRKFVSFLAPICQIQQGMVGLIFNIWHFEGFGDIHTKYQWIIGYGIIMCCEMLLCSLFITKYAFNPKDLELWQYSESFIIDQHNKQNIN